MEVGASGGGGRCGGRCEWRLVQVEVGVGRGGSRCGWRWK